MHGKKSTPDSGTRNTRDVRAQLDAWLRTQPAGVLDAAPPDRGIAPENEPSADHDTQVIRNVRGVKAQADAWLRARRLSRKVGRRMKPTLYVPRKLSRILPRLLHANGRAKASAPGRRRRRARVRRKHARR